MTLKPRYSDGVVWCFSVSLARALGGSYDRIQKTCTKCENYCPMKNRRYSKLDMNNSDDLLILKSAMLADFFNFSDKEKEELCERVREKLELRLREKYTWGQ